LQISFAYLGLIFVRSFLSNPRWRR